MRDVDIVAIDTLLLPCVAITIRTRDNNAVLDGKDRLIAVCSVIPSEVHTEVVRPVDLRYFNVSAQWINKVHQNLHYALKSALVIKYL